MTNWLVLYFVVVMIGPGGRPAVFINLHDTVSYPSLEECLEHAPDETDSFKTELIRVYANRVVIQEPVGACTEEGSDDYTEFPSDGD